MQISNVILLTLQILLVCSDHNLPSKSVKIDPNTVFVLFGTRHGNRNPGQYLPENPRTWGFEGFNELTSVGKRQSYGLGTELRKFIGNLTSNNYNASQVSYYSSSANRCQMTLQTVLAGLHPPETWGDWNTAVLDHWSPVPYSINDQLLRMYSVSECTQSNVVWKPIDNDQLPHLKQLLTEKRQLLNYFQANTGWNMSNLGNAADLADNLIEINLYNATLPAWITKPTINYTPQQIESEIMSFAEVHQIACADYAPCRNLMAGYWLTDILSKLHKASNNSDQKVAGYASHTEITLSVMKLLGITKDELTTSAGFVVELRKLPYPSIRLLNHDPNPIDSHVIYPATLVDALEARKDSNGFINLTVFENYVKPAEDYSNWKKACGIAAPTSSASSSFLKTAVLNATILSYVMGRR
ncbi:unnamed protein product [Caenorhabditis auriculariae]|uniref:Uncharacterized protein n=1 Tax=Caenorhabditis auriculariae TaxID=2777116 RepID=A0A8S1HS01_9PELO|nr:unnamed protein product [Caenorhabditis auriculariae]